MKTHAIIVAAGKSERFGKDKILYSLEGKPLIYHGLHIFEQSPVIDLIVVVTREDLIEKLSDICQKYNFTKVKGIVAGGKERQDSVIAGVNALDASSEDLVVVHNGANPLVTAEDIEKCFREAGFHGAAVCAQPCTDTVKKVREGFVQATLDRSALWMMQTPQCVRYGIMKKGIDLALRSGFTVTDDVSFAELAGGTVKIVECSRKNRKITFKEDIGLLGMNEMNRKNGLGMRVGIGQDSHRFVDSEVKKPLVLGGFTIENERGLVGNSDADVILHALFNACSSAIGGRSLSIDADEMCRNGVSDSSEYLKVVLDKVKDLGYSITNVSISIEALQPKLEQHHDGIRKSLCSLLDLRRDAIGLTFTTGEQLTGQGKGEGMACTCEVMVQGYGEGHK